MLVVKKPSAILYNWYKEGTFELTSDVYFEENLLDKVIVYSLPYNNIEEDFATLMEKIISIKETEDNEQSKKVRILALKVDFADTHRYFIMEALPRASIYKVSEEGVLDFNKHRLEETTEIIRNSGGLASTIARVAEKAK
jgi:hypothetical protein